MGQDFLDKMYIAFIDMKLVLQTTGGPHSEEDGQERGVQLLEQPVVWHLQCLQGRIEGGGYGFTSGGILYAQPDYVSFWSI